MERLTFSAEFHRTNKQCAWRIRGPLSRQQLTYESTYGARMRVVSRGARNRKRFSVGRWFGPGLAAKNVLVAGVPCMRTRRRSLNRVAAMLRPASCKEMQSLPKNGRDGEENEYDPPNDIAHGSASTCADELSRWSDRIDLRHWIAAVNTLRA